MLFDDNALPHFAGVSQSLIEQLDWEQFDRLPYSPDLAPSDYQLFLNMKCDFGGWSFDSDNDLENGVLQWLSSLIASFYEKGLEKLIFRYDKRLNNGGNYVEK